MRFIITVAAILLLFSSQKSEAAAFILRLGPTGLGNGGPNPLSIPPGSSDIELGFVSAGGFEANIGLPGLLFGYRKTTKWGGYVSLGGGAAIDANGAGPAGYSAFGWDFGWNLVKFNFEYKQAVGISSEALISPYAVRFGMGLWFH